MIAQGKTTREIRIISGALFFLVLDMVEMNKGVHVCVTCFCSEKVK